MADSVINLRDIDLNLLTVFDAIMREQNLTRAADRLGMSQPSVSAALNRLRRVFGDQLFVRTHRGVKATPRAYHYAPQIRRILDLVALMMTDSEHFNIEASNRRFRVVLGDYGEVIILPSLLQFLESAKSAVGIEVLSQHTVGCVDALREGTIDCVCSPEPLLGEGIKSELITEDRLVTLVRRDHPTVRGSLSLEQFVALQHAIFDWVDRRGFLIDQKLRAQGLQRQCPVRLHTIFDMPRIVATTNLACTVPFRFARQVESFQSLKSFPVPLEGLTVGLYCNWHQRFENDRGTVWLLETIRNIASFK